MRTAAGLLAGLLLLGGMTVIAADRAHAQWGYAAEVGALFDIPAGTKGMLAFTPAKYQGDEFSWGARFHVVPADWFEIAGAPVAQFHIRAKVHITAFMGLGVIYADYKGQNAFSMNMPFGASFGMPVSEQNILQFTFTLNIHNLPVGEDKDQYSYSLGVGLGHFP